MPVELGKVQYVKLVVESLECELLVLKRQAGPCTLCIVLILMRSSALGVRKLKRGGFVLILILMRSSAEYGAELNLTWQLI